MLNSRGQISENNLFVVDWIGFCCRQDSSSYSVITDRKLRLGVFRIIHRSFYPLLHHHGDLLLFVLKICGWNISCSKQMFPSGGRPGYKFMRKLRGLKHKLHTWNKEVFGDMRVKKKKFEKRIKELDILEGSAEWNLNLEEERSKAKSDWYELILKEERATMMKSKFTWAKKGDANTKLFHNLMNGRRATNAISKLERTNGEVLSGEENILEEILSFFSSLYSSSYPRFRGIDSIDWSPIIADDAADLVRPFEEEEVKKAVLDCEGNKSPGLDGFTLAFFQTC